MLITVNEAARQLAMSSRQVRRYVEQGLIESTRFGREIVVSDADVDRVRELVGVRGRAWTRETVSAVLGELDGEHVSYAGKFAKARVFATLRESEVEMLLLQCGRHSIARRYALPSLDRDTIGRELWLTGVSSVVAEGALSGGAKELEGYARGVSATEFVARWGLMRDVSGNLVLHVNDPLLNKSGTLSESQQIVDLYRSGDSRERIVAVASMAEQLENWRARNANRRR